MKARVKKKALVMFVFLLTWFASTDSLIFGNPKPKDDNQKPEVILTPMDAAVCISQNITYKCKVYVRGDSKGVKDKEIVVVFLTRNGTYQPVEGYRQINRYRSELTLSNVTDKDKNKIVCCTFGMNNSNCESEPSILNVYHSIQKLHKGEIFPLDPDVCFSQDITFSCTLLDPPQLNYSIGFAIKNESTNFQFVPVESRRITLINETLSELTLYNISVVELEYIYVKCYYWQTFGDLRATLQLGETSTASVYSMPRKVEEINCTVKNYDVSMNCSWNYGTGYDEGPDVEFKWRIPEYSKSWTDCQDLNKKYSYCYWNSSRQGDFTLKVIEINVTVSEPCGVQFSSNFTIDTRKIVIPAPVVGLKATVLNSTCVNVSWETTKQYFAKEHKVVVTSKWGDNQNLTFITTAETEKLPQERMFCKLFPYTEYTFAVSIQPTGQQAGFYSDPRQVVARTYSDIPASSPTVAEGGFSSFQGDCKNFNERRRVCVFWKPISLEEKNGPMKGLKGIFTPVGKTRHSIEVDWAEDLTFGCSSELLCNTTYMFTIWARNENGTSKNGSVLEISSATSGIKQPDFIVESASTSEVYVRWTYPEAANTKWFMVARCRNKDGDCENDGDVQWEYFPATAREASLKIDSWNSAQDFLYGVSTVLEDGSSGVEWEDCVYLKNKVPKRQPKNIIVSAGSDDNTLVVTWDKLTCRSDEPYIAMYNLQYNKLSDTSKKSLNISSDVEARVVLTELQEEKTYVVTIRAITEEGHYGPESQPVTGVPENKSLKAADIAGISSGALILVFLAGVGCFCAVSKCKKKAEMKLKDETKITIPPYVEDQHPIDEETRSTKSYRESVTSIERQNSDDSGFGQVSPSPEKFEHPPVFGKLPPEITRRPDDYVYVTNDKDRSEDAEMSSALHSATTNPDFCGAVGEQRNPTVGLILQDNSIPARFAKKALRNVDYDETFVKVRAKNESGDSGMSDAYSKATLGKLEEKNHFDDSNNVDADIDDGGDENTVLKEAAKNNGRITDNVSPCTSQNQTELHCNIPKPAAFSEYSDSNCSVLDKEDDLSLDKGVKLQPVNDTGMHFSPDLYTKAPEILTGTSSSTDPVTGAENPPELVSGAENPPDLVTGASSSLYLSTNSSSGLDFSPDYLVAKMPDDLTKNNQSSLSTPQFKLNEIPHPVVDGNESSSTDGFLQAGLGERNSSDLAKTPSQTENSKPKTVRNNNDYLQLTYSPNALMNSNSQQLGNTATAGMTQSLEHAYPSPSVDPQTVQTSPNSCEDNSEEASGTGSGTADGYLAHVSASHNPVHVPYQVNMSPLNAIEGHVTSCNLDYITNDPSRITQACDSQNYLPHSNVSQNQFFFSSASDGGSSLSQKDSFSDDNDTSGYVSNSYCFPDPHSKSTTFENSDRSLEPNHIQFGSISEIFPTRTVSDPENGYVDQSQSVTSLCPTLSSDFDQPVAGLKKTQEEQTDYKEYVDETFAQSRALWQNAVISENNDRVRADTMGKTNEYVPHDFLSQGLDSERHSENGREPLVLRNNDLSGKENMEERNADVSGHRDSGSGLGSLEKESLEIERRELDADNGYVSHDIAASMQL